METCALTTGLLYPANNLASLIEFFGVYTFKTKARQSPSAYSILVLKLNKLSDVHSKSELFLVLLCSNVRAELCLYRTVEISRSLPVTNSLFFCF